MSPWNWKFKLFILIFISKGCVNGGCEEKKHNARYSQQLQTGLTEEHPLKWFETGKP